MLSLQCCRELCVPYVTTYSLNLLPSPSLHLVKKPPQASVKTLRWSCYQIFAFPSPYSEMRIKIVGDGNPSSWESCDISSPPHLNSSSPSCADKHHQRREGPVQSVPLSQHRSGEVPGAELRAEPRRLLPGLRFHRQRLWRRRAGFGLGRRPLRYRERARKDAEHENIRNKQMQMFSIMQRAFFALRCRHILNIGAQSRTRVIPKLWDDSKKWLISIIIRSLKRASAVFGIFKCWFIQSVVRTHRSFKYPLRQYADVMIPAGFGLYSVTEVMKRKLRCFLSSVSTLKFWQKLCAVEIFYLFSLVFAS